MTGSIRVAIVGCGYASRQNVEAIALAGGGSIAAVVDKDTTRAGELARLTGAPARCLESVLHDASIDAVCICTPPETHASIAIAALRAGKGVVVEKPVARTNRELDSIQDAAAASTAPVVAMLQHRGRLPDAVLRAAWSSDAVATLEVVRPRALQHYASEPWRLDPGASGGGHVAHLGVHFLDLACQLLGTPARVAGLTSCRDVSGIETRAALGVQFVDGGLMTVLASAHPGRHSERLHVIDADHELIVDDRGTEYRVDGVAQRWDAPSTAHLRAAVYTELWAAVRREAPPDRYAIARARGVTAILEDVRKIAAEEPVLCASVS